VSRFWILAGAFTVTAATLALALALGAWGFDYRRYSLHEGRLKRALEQEPTRSSLTAGLAQEGAVVIASPETPDEMERVIADHAGDRAPEIREKAERWRHFTLYRAADMLYFVYFDDGEVMRDFTCVGG
jgi:hypothetical protein